jgi:hypothetical protein
MPNLQISHIITIKKQCTLRILDAKNDLKAYEIIRVIPDVLIAYFIQAIHTEQTNTMHFLKTGKGKH